MIHQSRTFSRILALMVSAALLSGLFAGCNTDDTAVSDASSDAFVSETAVNIPTFINPLPNVNLDAVLDIKAPEAQTLSSIQEKAAQNSDVVGWLNVPGTDINDEVLQNTENNEFYAHSDITKAYNWYGCYYVDYECVLGNRNTISKNTIIYGHNMDDNPNGLRFAQLIRFTDPAFAASHPYINFTTAEDAMVWKIFAVSYTDQYLPFYYPNKTGQDFMRIISDIRDRSIYDYAVDVNSSDKTLILSTCTYKYGKKNSEQRILIAARLVRPDEDVSDQTVKIVMNPSPVQPQFKKFKDMAVPYVEQAVAEAAERAKNDTTSQEQSAA